MTTDPLTLTPDEHARLAALHALALSDADRREDYQSLVALAGDLLGCPTVMLNLVDRNHVHIYAGTGPAQSFDREGSVCDTTVRQDATTIVEDLTRDARFAANPMVAGPDGLRFYAGAPIHATDADGVRQPIGTLCAVDVAPRTLSVAARRMLDNLVTLAEALIAARATAMRAVDLARESDIQAAELARKDSIFRQAERISMIGSWRFSLADAALEWSDNVYRIHGLPIGETPPIDGALDHYEPAARGEISAALARTIETGDPFAIEAGFITARAERRRVRAMGEIEKVDGQPVAIIGVFQDITDQHELETALRRSAETDMLTGLSNRVAFERTLRVAIDRARDEDAPLLLAMIDLDGFKAINDTLGHLAGDDVLRGVGRALRQPWMAGSCAARLGGDEFAVVIEDPALAADPAAVVRRLEDSLRVPVSHGGLGMIAAGTVGIATLEAEHVTVRDLIHAADTVLYTAKRLRVGERRRANRQAG
ncbi:MAG: diguanylate cyclase domain-containing protein [Janthinobacterium lividum]